jgi:hypothetical protein
VEPLLQAIGDFLDEHAEMIEIIRGDPRRGLKNADSATGAALAESNRLTRCCGMSRGHSFARPARGRDWARLKAFPTVLVPNARQTGKYREYDPARPRQIAHGLLISVRRPDIGFGSLFF